MKANQICFAVMALALGATQASAVPLTKWEVLEKDEQKEAEDSAAELIKQITNEFTKEGKRAFRDAHPRGMGCVAAKFTIDPAIPSEFRTGVFLTPGKSYDSLIRFSSSLGPAGDQTADARGMAIKLFGVPGKKLLEEQADATTADFIQIDAPAFPAPNTHVFAGIVKVKSNPAYIAKFLLESPIKNALALKNVISSSTFNPNNGKSLTERKFFSMVPYLLKGPNIETPIKFSSRPCTVVPTRKLNGTDTELRDDLQERLNEGDVCFDFMIQLYKQSANFKIEDGTNVWSEEKSPFIKVARIIIPKQKYVTDEKLAYCDALSFQPWHTTAEHQPLGNINRARKIVYEIISKHRHTTNKESALYKEPVDLSAWNALKSTTYSKWNAVKIPAN